VFDEADRRPGTVPSTPSASVAKKNADQEEHNAVGDFIGKFTTHTVKAATTTSVARGHPTSYKLSTDAVTTITSPP